MATKTQIKNMVDLINEKYRFCDETEEWYIRANKLLNGWEITIGPKHRISVVLTQYKEVTSDTCMMILSMLFHDILQRQDQGHYTITKRV